jgi:hypothetical protein
MGTTIHMSKSRTFPVTVEEAFDRLLPMPLEALFTRWCGPIPPVRSTEQNGIWGTAGQRRVVRFVGPGSVLETLVRVDRPHEFSYELSEPTGPLALIVARVQGRWAFEPAGTGVRITWSWDVEARNRAARQALPAFARFWRGYARGALEGLEGILLSSQEST